MLPNIFSASRHNSLPRQLRQIEENLEKIGAKKEVFPIKAAAFLLSNVDDIPEGPMARANLANVVNRMGITKRTGLYSSARIVQKTQRQFLQGFFSLLTLTGALGSIQMHCSNLVTAGILFMGGGALGTIEKKVKPLQEKSLHKLATIMDQVPYFK
ncbi:MAG: hypothetical protein HEQ32_02205 [Vampirovibrio sp.]